MSLRYGLRLLYFIIFLLLACGSDKKERTVKESKPEKIVNVPPFSPDSAYYFIEKQINFGPRIPNSQAHRLAGDYLVSKLRSYEAKVEEQHFEAQAYDGTKLYLRNIIASLFPEKSKRLLLAAHWDTRPFADKDTNNPDASFDGANDGASGVAVWLEVARVLSSHTAPDVGIDIIFFDGEDWGEKINGAYTPTPPELESWWCLGSQHWAKNKHQPNYSAYYGILLDMVGAKGARFYKEGISRRHAPKIVRKIWKQAATLGHGNIFVNKGKPEIVDDHKFVNEIAKIPMVNIVHYDPEVGYFGDYHHTTRDNLDLIDKTVLSAVGETVLNVIYHE